MTIGAAESHPEDLGLLQQVFQDWQAGNQQPALDRLTTRAADGGIWADSLAAWLYMQQGVPGFVSATPHAIRASRGGMPWSAVQLFNNSIGNLQSAPQLAATISEVARAALPWGQGIDPIGQGWNLLAQGRPAEALQLMTLRLPSPLFPDDWEQLSAMAAAKLAELDTVTKSAAALKEDLDATASAGQEAIRRAADEVKTSAGQAGLLITTIVSDGATSLYKAAAKRSEGESKNAWVWGLRVLGIAAVIAVLPLAVHYVGLGPKYQTSSLVLAHLASTLALASFAGVLLARARSRDLATQRNYDLETAMGTMVSYSNQITDPTEKQKFLMLMGQLVLQAHLSSGQSGGSEESLAGLLALANLIKPGVSPT